MAIGSKRAIALQLKALTILTQSGCWEWSGKIYHVGYPFVSSRFGYGTYGHRAMYSVIVGQIPAGMYVLHTCDNRKCMNPEHLFLGTHLDNIKDMHAKNRQRGGSMPNEKNPSCKFSNEVVRAIRSEYADGKRKCEIERAYGVSETQYYRIVRGEVRKEI